MAYNQNGGVSGSSSSSRRARSHNHKQQPLYQMTPQEMQPALNPNAWYAQDAAIMIEQVDMHGRRISKPSGMPTSYDQIFATHSHYLQLMDHHVDPLSMADPTNKRQRRNLADMAVPQQYLTAPNEEFVPRKKYRSWKTMTEEDRESERHADKERIRAVSRERWANLDEDAKQKKLKYQVRKVQERRAKMSDEERTRVREYEKNRRKSKWLNMEEGEKEKVRDNQKQRVREKNSLLTDQERVEKKKIAAEKQRERYWSQTPEQRAAGVAAQRMRRCGIWKKQISSRKQSSIVVARKLAAALLANGSSDADQGEANNLRSSSGEDGEDFDMV